jgi:putative RNA 2'-phosphotransferase
MNDARRTRVSKYLALHLRHQPEVLGLTLETGGWVPVDTFLIAAASHGFPITRGELAEVVAKCDKKRYAFDPAGAKIRANQGHSTEVELDLPATPPPAELYHGTATRFAALIRAEGLKKMARHHVHLSADLATAVTVGRRHGRPLVFVVDATSMSRDGFTFYRSANGVWLVDAVPPRYLCEATPA